MGDNFIFESLVYGLIWAGFFAWWHINLCGVFNALAIFVKGQ